MSDLREDLYAFRKQMREVFIRVEDMVDVHRSFFKSDPSTGSPVFKADLQQEAEKLATQAFEQLSDLRKQFTRLVSDFQRSEQPRDECSDRDHERKQLRATTTRAPPRSRREQQAVSRRAVSSHGSDDEGISVKGSAVSDDDGSDRDSSDERPREHSSSISRTRASSQADSDDDAPPATMPDSVRSTTSTFLSSQLQSRWGNPGGSIANGSDISSRSRGRSPSIVSDVSSLPDQCSRTTSEHQTDSIFQDFDKRMEEIRCSLNAIASGKKPHRSSDRVAAVSPKNFKHGDSVSMMDAARTRSTLREASRISTAVGLDVEGSNGIEAKPPRGAREAELRQLLKQLNQLNGDNEADG
ncbi:hypothetical protein PHYSODRAFT_318433 [Phytophthora sojae]|uniref:Uncharacterized protein n=1 Tax=Phytophthora sojae (strain P6497) TaxID=1094619 RepID=G5A2S3_PHYSP|nr:hypothetical protein PHYSODRAFT_318433 [Phytophthora sojae]EGZ09963.1 hypothetical protein PHYSODRAFT_318433 [Phytophthora sojae]|eukprot:XP_009534824.1 hypothetical protein PHYSODRAFT_318433 [Phytophthora sojae]